MKDDIRIVNARIWDGFSLKNLGFTVTGGRFSRIAADSHLPEAERTFDAMGMAIFPGFIDSHVHLRDFSDSYKEDFLSGTGAAVAGGFTTVLDMPNTSPPVTTAPVLVERKAKAREKILSNVGFYSSPATIDDVGALSGAGSIAFKVYLANSLEGTLDYSDTMQLMTLMSKIKSSKGLLVIHAEDATFFSRKENVGIDYRPVKAETVAIDKVIEAASGTRCSVHIAHISTEEGLKKVTRAKRDGTDISCESSPHHSFLDQENTSRTSLTYCFPPLRSKSDREAVFEGIVNGAVDMIASDHAPHSLQEKQNEMVPGFPGLEVTLPLMLDMVSRGKLTLKRLCELMISYPCARFNLKDRGEIREGYWGDFTIINLKKKNRIRADKFHSKAKYSPFDGRDVVGSVYATFVKGRTAFLENRLVGTPGMGEVLEGNTIPS